MHKQYHKQTVATDYAAHRANLSQPKEVYQQVKFPSPKLSPSPLEIKAGESRA